MIYFHWSNQGCLSLYSLLNYSEDFPKHLQTISPVMNIFSFWIYQFLGIRTQLFELAPICLKIGPLSFSKWRCRSKQKQTITFKKTRLSWDNILQKVFEKKGPILLFQIYLPAWWTTGAATTGAWYATGAW